MPRGVYDRSKLKKSKPEKTASATPAKRGPGRPPGRKAHAVKEVAKEAAPLGGLGGMGQVAQAFGHGGDLHLLHEIRNNLSTLHLLSDKFGDLPAVKSEVAANVEAMANLRKQIFKELAQANGTAQVTQYPSTVPMPPSVPSIPSASH